MSRKYISGFILACIFSFALGTPLFSHAQTTETPAEKQSRLEAELVQVEKEQAETQKILFDAQNQSASLQRDILILNTKIKAAELNIKAKNLLIETLGKDISKKEATIETLEERIERGQETLAQIMRKTNETDTITLPEILLSQDTLTGVFYDLDSFESVEEALKRTFEEIRSAKSQTEVEKNTLDKRKNQEQDARYAIQQEQKDIQSNKAESQRLLNVSKNNEQTYSQLLAEKQKKGAQIRAALFALRDTAAIPFGDALRYAQAASQVTGVRPAFLLAILTQESDLGKNIGSCLVSSLDTGDGVGKNTGTVFQQVMKAPRDTAPFKNITDRLGRDWKMTPVSCPPETTYYVGRGFGGGMGPSQFIPSTWELMKGGIGKALGLSGDSVDPWNPQHAFMATAVYMRELGAAGGSYTTERNAACRYYSGTACQTTRKPANAFYGNQVMAKADLIQRTMIDPLQGI